MAKRGWDFIENPKNKRWYLEIGAGTATKEYPSVSEIRERAKEKGIDPFSVSHDAELEKRLKIALASAGEETSFPIVIDPTFDVRLIVAPDKTSASLYIRKSADRKAPLDLKLISGVLNGSKLQGMDIGRIKMELDRFRNSPEMELPLLPLAQGIPAGRGKDRELLEKVDWLSDAEAAELMPGIRAWCTQLPLSEAEQAHPVSECTRFARVVKDEILYEITPPETGTPGQDVYGKPIPGLPGNDPFFQAYECITLSGSTLRAEKTGILAASTKESLLKLRVIPYLDARATAVVDADRMTASVILENSEGAGTPLSESLVLAALAKEGIKGEFDLSALSRAIDTVRRSGISEEVVVLRGREAVPPGGLRYTWHKPIGAGGATANITPGERILSTRRIPAGEDGFDVFGKTLPAASGQKRDEPAHDGTVTETTENGERVYSAGHGGEISFSDSRLAISGSKEITSNADESTGDILFPGNLILNGEIMAGRTVKAAGSLTVNGNAGASLVSADESVTMNGGILGKGRGTVWAKQAIHLTFAENARLLASQDITVDNYCFQCSVKTNRMLIMRGNPGVLLGGSVRATRGIEVFELGSSKTIRTSVSFGQNYLIGDQIEVCEKEVQKIKDSVAKLDEMMKRTSNTDPRIHELRRKKLELLKMNDKLTVRIFTLKEQYETHIISHVRVENTVYPGVILESHGRYYEVREQKTHVVFIFDQITGQITCTPIPAAEE